MVFNTPLTGYQRSSPIRPHAGQFVTLTYPHIGNVGVNRRGDVESRKGICLGPHHPRPARRGVSSFRAEQSSMGTFVMLVVGIADIDTRKLTRILRDKAGTALADGWPAISMSKARPSLLPRLHPAWPGWTCWWWRGCPRADWTQANGVLSHDADAKSRTAPSTTAQNTTSCACWPSAAARSPWCRRKRQRKTCFGLQPTAWSSGPGDPEPCDYAIAAIKRRAALGDVRHLGAPADHAA